MSDPLAAGSNPQIRRPIDGLVIRPIRDGDAEAISEALRELGTPEHPGRGLERQNEGLGVFLLALLNDETVGYLTLHWRASPRSPEAWKDGLTAYVEDFVVVESHRRRGIGSAMMETSEAMSRDRGLSRMTVGVGVENDGTRRLYERLGYKDAGLADIEDAGQFQRWDGRTQEYQETWRFMVKGLRTAHEDSL